MRLHNRNAVTRRLQAHRAPCQAAPAPPIRAAVRASGSPWPRPDGQPGLSAAPALRHGLRAWPVIVGYPTAVLAVHRGDCLEIRRSGTAARNGNGKHDGSRAASRGKWHIVAVLPPISRHPNRVPQNGSAIVRRWPWRDHMPGCGQTSAAEYRGTSTIPKVANRMTEAAFPSGSLGGKAYRSPGALSAGSSALGDTTIPIPAVAAATGMPRQSGREFAGTGTFPRQTWVTTVAPSAGKRK
jgi:hypothetical protein